MLHYTRVQWYSGSTERFGSGEGVWDLHVVDAWNEMPRATETTCHTTEHVGSYLFTP